MVRTNSYGFVSLALLLMILVIASYSLCVRKLIHHISIHNSTLAKSIRAKNLLTNEAEKTILNGDTGNLKNLKVGHSEHTKITKLTSNLPHKNSFYVAMTLNENKLNWSKLKFFNTKSDFSAVTDTIRYEQLLIHSNTSFVGVHTQISTLNFNSKNSTVILTFLGNSEIGEISVSKDISSAQKYIIISLSDLKIDAILGSTNSEFIFFSELGEVSLPQSLKILSCKCLSARKNNCFNLNFTASKSQTTVPPYCDLQFPKSLTEHAEYLGQGFD